MTVETETSRVSYTGSGSTGPFTIPFYFIQNEDIVAIKRTIADGTEETLTITTDYTLSGAGSEAGGTLTLVSSLSSSYQLIIYRDPQVLQEARFPRNDKFPAATNERVVDLLTMIAQRHSDLLERSIRLTDGDTSGAAMLLPVKTARASMFLAFDADGEVTASPGTDGVGGALAVALAASSGSSLVGFLQSGSAASLTVQEKLRQTKAMVDFITDNTIRAAVIAGTNVADLTTYVQAALDSGYNLDLQGYTFYANNLTDSDAGKSLVSTVGIGRIVKNANGALFTSSGDNYTCINVSFRGDASSPVYTGDGAVFTGDHPVLINCGSRWMAGRALKCTGSHAQVCGTCDIYQTTDATATGYDIEIGVSGTLTTYHELHGIYSSQPTGGILLTDTGSHTIVGGEFGKLKIDAGTSPSGVNGGKTIGARILGDVSVEISNAVFSANQFGAITFTLEAGTSACCVDVSNKWPAVGHTVVNNGNANNLIMREVSSGSTNQIKFGDDSDFGTMRISPSSPGQFVFTELGVVNNSGVRFRNAADNGEDGAITFSVAGDLGITNSGTNRTITYATTGTASGSRHQFLVNGSRRVLTDNNGTQFEGATGATANIKQATSLLSAVSGATVTATNLIPDGAFVLGVTTRITTTLGVSNGTTGYAVGDSGDPNRWGDIVGTASGTTSNNTNATANFTGAYIAADSVIITAAGGNFDGTGAIRVVVLYIDTTAPTS